MLQRKVIIFLSCIAICTMYGCVTHRKPVASQSQFHSNWSPKLTINVPEGFTQHGPFILQGKERMHGVTSEAYYPYIKHGDKGTTEEILSVTMLLIGDYRSGMRWKYNSIESTNISVAGGSATLSERELYFTVIDTYPFMTDNLAKRLTQQKATLKEPFITKNYIRHSPWGQRVIVSYSEKADKSLVERIRLWQSARVNQKGIARDGKLRIPDTFEFPPDRDIELFLEEFEKRADDIFSPLTSKRFDWRDPPGFYWQLEHIEESN